MKTYRLIALLGAVFINAFVARVLTDDNLSLPASQDRPIVITAPQTP
jgi:hypothetical protein